MEETEAAAAACGPSATLPTIFVLRNDRALESDRHPQLQLDDMEQHYKREAQWSASVSAQFKAAAAALREP